MTVDIRRTKRPIEILLVEDNLGDAVLMKEAMKFSRFPIHLSVARDGLEALEHLRGHVNFSGRPSPDLILLDLKLPKMDGREVLAEIKADPEWKQIPVLVMTASQAEEDRLSAYERQANFYLIKPMNLDDFFETLKYIDDFWLKNIT